jgi:hypothetical protein
MRAKQRRAAIGGIIFLVLGIMFLLEALDLYTLAPSTLWPVLLLALGVGVLAGIGDDDSEDQSPGIR